MMKRIILASTSSLHGETYLAYLKPRLKTFFKDIETLLFIPYARPGGIGHEDYTLKVAEAFAEFSVKVTGLHTYNNPAKAIQNAQLIFTGGGNTFLLVKQLHELGLMSVLKDVVESGTPYLGTSAGSNIGGINMQNTNDMPIVYPPSFDTMGLVPFNINAHYLDPDSSSKHNGETRETRIKEFHVFNSIPVVGLREGSWIECKDGEVRLEGMLTAVIFLQGKEPFEADPGSLLL